MNAVNRFVILFLSLFLSLGYGQAQKSKTQLQKDRQKSLTRIKETEKILNETSKKKKNTLGELSALNARIKEQENLVGSIKSEVEIMDQDLQENYGILNVLSEDLEKMRAEYASMMFATQRASSGVNKLTFLFSSKSFDQFMSRMKYMEQYGQARQEQAKAIRLVQEQLTTQVRHIDSLRAEKSVLLKEELKENDQLKNLKEKQKTVVRSLEKEEKKLRKDLEDTKKAVAKLDKLISEIVKEELARAARESKAKNAVSSAAVALTSASFEGNKKKFAWPVSGFVSQRFGRQKHPVLPRVETWNDGINIQTREGEKVKSIFKGEVRRVAFIPGIGPSVIINHGEYFSVYAGLKDVSIKMGDKVETNQVIGSVIMNAEGKSELRFQIRKNVVALDPEEWLIN
ncbi:MAG: murein hydrolase activator EnvC family protein [Cyclobacteriaceae bacterium]|jgi:septal ring factor EnvC (AmiA/AmiB activator)